MTHDRDYYRCTDTAELVRLARDSGHELAIALGERLDELAWLTGELDELRDKLDLARGANIALRAELEAYEEAYERELDDRDADVRG